jgi:[ribosomal protein S5]-alanine N-acetyltransferase
MHLALRPIELGDAAAIQLYASEAELAATCNVPHPYPAGGGLRWAEKSIEDRAARRRFTSAIIVDDAFVGLIGLNAVNFNLGTGEVDYWVGRPFWGRGIATAAVASATELAFDELGLVQLSSGCRLANPASARVLEKNGFNEINPVVNSGRFGTKFLGETIRRFTLLIETWQSRRDQIRCSTARPLLVLQAARS